MNRADERALAYAKSHAYLGYDYDQTYDAVKYGYLQAEQDLALTWKDMAKIDAIILDVNNEFAVDYSKKISRQKFYEEVLKRFNEVRKK